MEKKIIEITKIDYSSNEKYVLSKLKQAEETIQDLTNENILLNQKLATVKHKITLKELDQLRKDFFEDMDKLDKAYFEEHNTYRPKSNDILEEFVNWLELGGYEIYIRQEGMVK